MMKLTPVHYIFLILLSQKTLSIPIRDVNIIRLILTLKQIRPD